MKPKTLTLLIIIGAIIAYYFWNSLNAPPTGDIAAASAKEFAFAAMWSMIVPAIALPLSIYILNRQDKKNKTIKQ